MGIKPCAGQIYLWEEEEPALFLMQSELLAPRLCQHEPIIIKLLHAGSVLWSWPWMLLMHLIVGAHYFRYGVWMQICIWNWVFHAKGSRCGRFYSLARNLNLHRWTPWLSSCCLSVKVCSTFLMKTRILHNCVFCFGLIYPVSLLVEKKSPYSVFD